MTYWLMKSEPDVFSIDDLAAMPKQTAPWDGVRNYQVRNWMRDSMSKDDLAFFYHSSCAVPGIVGIMRITRTAYPDTTAFDPQSTYYDPKSDPQKPRWFCVDVKLVEKFKKIITLTDLKNHTSLKHMRLLQKGNRLSILPLSVKEWEIILSLQE